ncbi:potassium channel family protein [Georgenia sp. EYE_87]|uniref:potassium channel family protein n=1 Tax=Georgenia sp. EYE_87 TaxID=2853448 RepID=UPI002003AE62|nr:potassium channel family protein [Georgenia sp. EYE_87]MCK6210759.1 potassium channel family protein [Georgenia sp. EYE_87]
MIWWSVLGAALIGTALWDVFHTLWHPSGQGRLGHTVMALVWRLLRRRRPRLRQLGGPLAMVTVLLAWVVLVGLGGALVFWPHLPGGFNFASGLDPLRGEFVDAVYLSLVTLTTLGFGDIVPTNPWLRLFAPLEALIGFALLTAVVSWVLQVYPALTRRRALALRLAFLRDAGTLDSLDRLSAPAGARILDGLATAVVHARVDLTQYAETFYFQEKEPDATLAVTVRYAHDLACAGERSEHAEVRLAARTLGRALDDLAQLLDEQFLHRGGDTADVLAAYADAQTGP